MISYDTQRAQAAVQFLVDDPYAQARAERIRNASKRPRSLPFRGDAEVLNELVIIGRQNPQALENLIEVAFAKRDYDRNEYLKRHTYARRARERKRVRIEEMVLNMKLSVDGRKDLLLRVYDEWNTNRDRYVEQRAEEYRKEHGKEPHCLIRNQFIADYWQQVDAELDRMLKLASKHAPTLKEMAARRTLNRVTLSGKSTTGEA